MLIKTFIAAMLLSSPVAAEPLWQNIETGMTAEQVVALYPNARVRRDKIEIRDYRPLPNCPSTVVIAMRPNVSGVEVRGAGSLTGGCAGEIQNALSVRYGRPSEQDYDVEHWGRLFGYQTQVTETHVWVSDDVVMRFQRLEDRGLMFPSWTMVYIPREQIEAERDRQRAVGL